MDGWMGAVSCGMGWDGQLRLCVVLCCVVFVANIGDEDVPVYVCLRRE